MPNEILVTGGAGAVATAVRRELAGGRWRLRLLDLAEPPEVAGAADAAVVRASVTDVDAVAAACAGVQAVVHLAGIRSEAPFADLLATNVAGTHAVLEAARRVGVRRVVIGSSHHAVGFTPRGGAPPEGLPADIPARPDTYYGWSKAAMEDLGRLYADRFGMDVLAWRIGTVLDRPRSPRHLATWLSPADAARFLAAAVTAPPFGYRAVWGISANTRRWWSLAAGAALGYHPVDDAEAFAAEVLAGTGAAAPGAADGEGSPDPPDPAERVGGDFCRLPLGG